MQITYVRLRLLKLTLRKLKGYNIGRAEVAQSVEQ